MALCIGSSGTNPFAEQPVVVEIADSAGVLIDSATVTEFVKSLVVDCGAVTQVEDTQVVETVPPIFQRTVEEELVIVCGENQLRHRSNVRGAHSLLSTVTPVEALLNQEHPVTL